MFGLLESLSGLALPLAIFTAELMVLTLATLRVVAIARGKKLLASMLGLIEISIWLFAIGQIMQNLNNLYCYVAFASGFTLGNFLGLWIEEKLALGHLVVRIVTVRDAQPLVEMFRARNYGVTHFDGHGAKGPVHLVITVIERKVQQAVLQMIREFDPRAFYYIDGVQKTAAGIFPGQRHEPRVAGMPGYRLANTAETEPRSLTSAV